MKFWQKRLCNSEKKQKQELKKKLKTVSEKCRTPLITPTYALNYNTRRRIEREWSRKTYFKKILTENFPNLKKNILIHFQEV